jgi:LacI family transcriptional regulator, gluconate utilization system Gnt-I transcriptional repressor
MALGSLFECMQRGRRVPQDMGIAGFNDFEVMEAAYPAITSVYTPRWEIGYEAVKMLRRRLDGDDSGEKIIDLGFKVVTRESTDRNGQLGRIRAQNADES